MKNIFRKSQPLNASTWKEALNLFWHLTYSKCFYPKYEQRKIKKFIKSYFWISPENIKLQIWKEIHVDEPTLICLLTIPPKTKLPYEIYDKVRHLIRLRWNWSKDYSPAYRTHKNLHAQFWDIHKATIL